MSLEDEMKDELYTNGIRLPNGAAALGNTEERAIDQFRKLIDGYAIGITALNGRIGSKSEEVKALQDAIGRLTREQASMIQERDTKFVLMEGVQALVRQQEDAQVERERREADAARTAALHLI